MTILSGDQSDQISKIGALADRLVSEFHTPLTIAEIRFTDTTGNPLVVKINGIEITQEMLDSVDSFVQNGLTLQNIADGIYALNVIKGQILNSLTALEAIAKVK